MLFLEWECEIHICLSESEKFTFEMTSISQWGSYWKDHNGWEVTFQRGISKASQWQTTFSAHPSILANSVRWITGHLFKNNTALVQIGCLFNKMKKLKTTKKVRQVNFSQKLRNIMEILITKFSLFLLFKLAPSVTGCIFGPACL